MANSLSRVRKAFGWSQDAMAETLGVHLRTIIRWEAVEPPDINPFLKFVWVTASRHANRLYRYGSVLVPKSYLGEVRNSTSERALFIGGEAVVLAMSRQTQKTWGVFRYAEGMSVAAFSSKPERPMLAANYDTMAEICSAGDGSRVVRFVTSEAPAGSLPPLWRLHVMHAPFPEVFDMVSVPISEQAYHATEPKFWISDAEASSATLPHMARGGS